MKRTFWCVRVDDTFWLADEDWRIGDSGMTNDPIFRYQIHDREHAYRTVCSLVRKGKWGKVPKDAKLKVVRVTATDYVQLLEARLRGMKTQLAYILDIDDPELLLAAKKHVADRAVQP